MKQEKKMCSNENNLYNFYRLVGKGRYASLTEAGGYSYVAGKVGAWPQVIFDVRYKTNIVEQLDQAFEVANETGNTTIAVVNKKLLMECDQEQLRTFGIYPIALWPLMEIKEPGNARHSNLNFDMKELEYSYDFKAFNLLMNDGFNSWSGVSEGLLGELVEQKSISIYGIFQYNKLVGGLLTFADAQLVAGLYFIVIHKEYRGRGYGRALTEFVIRDLFNKGTRKVILQSYSSATTFYNDTGFIKNGALVVLMRKNGFFSH